MHPAHSSGLEHEPKRIYGANNQQRLASFSDRSEAFASSNLKRRQKLFISNLQDFKAKIAEMYILVKQQVCIHPAKSTWMVFQELCKFASSSLVLTGQETMVAS